MLRNKDYQMDTSIIYNKTIIIPSSIKTDILILFKFQL